MARERIIAADPLPQDETIAPPTLRPRSFDDFIGQRELIEKLLIALEAARQRDEPLEHVLLHGPPGLGKTTLAHVIAHEMSAHVHITSGPALTKGGDLVGTLTRMQPSDILFIDEIHRLPVAVEEYIYPAMEDFRIDFTVDRGMHARVVTYNLKPFTLIGATTRAGLLTGALRTRFGLTHHLQFYETEALVEILLRAAPRLQLTEFDEHALHAIASRSRGTPRVALRLLRRARDFAQVRGEGRLAEAVIAEALALEGVDERGLDNLDRRYLHTIASVYGGGPVGVEALAATLSEDSGTIEDVIEPFLLQIGFVARTRQGRCLTDAAAVHLNLSGTDASPTNGLFSAGDTSH